LERRVNRGGEEKGLQAYVERKTKKNKGQGKRSTSSPARAQKGGGRRSRFLHFEKEEIGNKRRQ